MSNKALKKILKDDLNNFEHVGLNDENKAKGLAAIGKEMSLLMAEEKQEIELELRKEQMKIDSEKLELSKKQYDLDKKIKEQELDNEAIKRMLERERLDEELKLKKSRISFG